MRAKPCEPPMSVNSPTAEFGNLGWLALIWQNGLLPSLLGAAAVVSVLPLNFAACAIWIALLASSVRKHRRCNRPKLAVASAITQLAVFFSIVTAAHLVPGKTTDRFLDRTITIPRSPMTLAELAGDPDGPPPEWRPPSVSLSVAGEEKTKRIVFPATTLTLRQFVRAIESQSTLRHRFAHCGNGWTILWGGDCSFGLHLCHPPDKAY